MGDFRFTLGALIRILRKKRYPCHVALKPAEVDFDVIHGTYAAAMELAKQNRRHHRRKSSAIITVKPDSVAAASSTQPTPDGRSALDCPYGPDNVYGGVEQQVPDDWMIVKELGDVQLLMGGKVPWCGPGMMMHPFALPNDGALDLTWIKTDETTRLKSLRFFHAIESGKQVFLPMVPRCMLLCLDEGLCRRDTLRCARIGWSRGIRRAYCPLTGSPCRSSRTRWRCTRTYCVSSPSLATTGPPGSRRRTFKRLIEGDCNVGAFGISSCASSTLHVEYKKGCAPLVSPLLPAAKPRRVVSRHHFSVGRITKAGSHVDAHDDPADAAAHPVARQHGGRPGHLSRAVRAGDAVLLGRPARPAPAPHPLAAPQPRPPHQRHQPRRRALPRLERLAVGGA